MLDVNSDQRSSEFTDDEMKSKNEKTPSKQEQKEVVKTDDVQEESLKVDEVIENETNVVAEKEGGKPEELKNEKADHEKDEVLDKVDIQVEEDKTAEEKSDKKEVVTDADAAESQEAVTEPSEKSVEESVEESEKVEKEKSEAKENIKKTLPVFDLAALSLEESVKMIHKLLNDFEIKEVKSQIENLKLDFQKKFRALIAEQKEKFVKSGGEESEFFYTDPIKNKFDEVLAVYKRKRQQFYKEVERTQKENLELKLSLIDELKALIDNAESSTMYKNFRNLQERWREVGQIPHAKYNDVWRTYHHHVERFYDLLHLNNDLRDLDFRHNLEEKTKLIEKAETLAEEEDINHAFKELQILHRMWKEDIGPVARELREEVWHKFSEATKKIHKRRHEFQDLMDEKSKANIGLKLAVIEKIKAIDTSQNKNHKDWLESIKNLDKLRDEFFAIGRVPKSKNEEIWQLFRETTRSFNAEKNSFYKGIKKEQAENLKKKLMLIEQAESLKDSEDWSFATEVYKKIQSEWKKIGHVPRHDSDKIWKRFKDACNHYFDRLHEKKNDLDKNQSAIIDTKKEFIESLKEIIEKGEDLTIEFVQKGMEQWRALGVLPHKVKHLDAKFNKLMDSVYKKLDIDKDEANFLRFKGNVDSLLDQNNIRKLDSEQLFIRRKIDEITKEIKQLENNISFISNASEDNPLIKNVYKNIEEYKRSLVIWKRKIDYMKKMEY